ncbi:hypothetical protein BaRGS_00003112, partial [Batillaria attramentaria]
MSLEKVMDKNAAGFVGWWDDAVTTASLPSTTTTTQTTPAATTTTTAGQSDPATEGRQSHHTQDLGSRRQED